jgi:pimeloyl-ACP methyl ester carboxylesterase
MKANLIASSLAALTSLTIVAAAQNGSPPPLDPPGRLIDVGGWRLHLDCTGTRNATTSTVILEAGVGDFSVEWSLVQPGVARFARVCSYDRAGDGWSDLGPAPRTMHQIVYELHTLLDRAGERPPFVLVGHSFGGWPVQWYTSTYRSEVAGLVLVEPGVDDPLRVLFDGRTVRSSHSSDLVTGQAIPAIQTSNPLRESDISPEALKQITAGLSSASLHANEAPRDKLPIDAQRMRTWALGQVKHYAAAFNPFEDEELAGLRADHGKLDHPLGDLPLVVLTRGLLDEKGPDAPALEAEHRKAHATMAMLSRRGKLVVAEHSGHHVQLDEAQLVVTTIQETVIGTSK